ncbi:MAG: sensor domain-containing diguanylate cyclase [Chloroflexi bacterium]|nr:sensor domain-containing diguanylate cyclase [Chloroflexota bacterium]
MSSYHRACEVIRSALAADEVYVLQAGDPDFVRIDGAGDAKAYEIKQKGYWLVWRELSTHAEVAGVMFDARSRLMERVGQPVGAGAQGTHLAAILPGDGSGSELLVARGPWPDGLSVSQADFVVASRLVLAHLIGRIIDADRSERKRDEMQAIADVSRAFSEAREMSDVLTSVATALASASRFEWVTINLFDGSGERVVERALNAARHGSTDTAAMMRDGRLAEALRARPVMWWDAVSRGQPFILADVFAPDAPTPPELKAYFERAHIVSLAVIPVLFQQRTIGTVKFASSTSHRFGRQEEQFLDALVSEVSTIMQALRLHRDLRASHEALQLRAAELEGTSRIEHYLARTDALTRLPNRRYIEEVLASECARAGRSLDPLAVVMADLDHFKMINDTFGHHRGDQALRFFASIARAACRTQDLVGRLGGDEFAFILPATSAADAIRVADRVHHLLRTTDFAEPGMPKAIHITASLGIAEMSTPSGQVGSGSLIEIADRALYAAKEAGRNRTVVAKDESRRVA